MANKLIDLSDRRRRLNDLQLVEFRGRISELTGLVVKATIPGVRIGELCLIDNKDGRPPVKAEVVGFRSEAVILMPLGELIGISPNSDVVPTGRPLSVKVGDALLGCVLNGLGERLDGKTLPLAEEREVMASPPDPMRRKRITKPLATGVKAIDGLITVGEGQRVGVFAGAGVGKSTLMGMIVRNTEADINVVGLIGERGRELREFIENDLGEEGLARSVVVVATSDEPSLVRLKAAHVATTIAEYFRDRGLRVNLLMDSVTRFARAQREVGLAVGEPPTRQGFPPSVFKELPRLLERSGNSDTGSITAFYTVLVAGDDMREPIADEVTSILDGHLVLSRDLANRGHYPAIDVSGSLSRLMSLIADPTHQQAAIQMREIIATYEKERDLIIIGAYEAGSDPKVDRAIDMIERVNQFLVQDRQDRADFQQTVQTLTRMFG